jgi:hypothetical protein
MPESRLKQILDEWRAVANAAERPVEAPTPPPRAGSVGIAVAAVVVVVVLAALLIRGAQVFSVPSNTGLGPQSSTAPLGAEVASPTPPATASPNSTAVPSPMVPETSWPSLTAVASPSPTPVASSVPLPNPGGTCSASQFVVGQATSQGEPATLGTIHVGLRQPVQNTGADCVLALPTVIGFAGPSGPFQAVEVGNLGHVVWEKAPPGAGVERLGHYVYPTSFPVKSGQTVRIEFNASWFNGDYPGFTPPPCAGTISGVTRAEFPLASGSIIIEWDTAFGEVCGSPPSVSVTVDN